MAGEDSFAEFFPNPGRRPEKKRPAVAPIKTKATMPHTINTFVLEFFFGTNGEGDIGAAVCERVGAGGAEMDKPDFDATAPGAAGTRS